MKILKKVKSFMNLFSIFLKKKYFFVNFEKNKYIKKNMKNKLLVSILFLFVSLNLISQDAIFETSKDSLKYYKKNFKKGELFFENMNYPLAIQYLEEASTIDSGDANLSFMLGVSYLYTLKAKKAIHCLETAFAKSDTISGSIHYLLANAYHYDYQFISAIREYEIHSQKADSLEQISIKRYIQECKNGLEITKDTLKFDILNFGSSINSKYGDYAAYILPGDSLMVFTSKRDNNIGGYTSPYDGEYYEDIYFSKKKGDTFSESYNPGRPLNTESPDACTGISEDGSVIYLYSDINSGDIFKTSFTGEKWDKPSSFSPINTISQESNIAFSKEGQFIYFVSNRMDSSGKDIFVIEKISDTTYSEPKNLGLNVNTIYDEDCIYINAGNDSLYFSSRGHNSMGGYDVFLSVKDKKGNWQKSQNVGFPINTAYDDMYFRPYKDKFYYSSVHPESIGKSDIYWVLRSEEKLPETPEIIVLNAKELFAEINDYFIISDILFAMNEFENKESLAMLNKFATYLNEHKEIIVEICGYSDTQGGTNYNDNLAKKRASFVYNSLINNKVADKQLTLKSRGEENQISINKDEKSNYIKTSLAYNRRVEFKVITEGTALEVERIEVPKQYRISKEESKSINKKYSIMLDWGVEKQELSSFEYSNVQELTKDGNYFYYFGQFDNLKASENAKNKALEKYTKAYVFSNKN